MTNDRHFIVIMNDETSAFVSAIDADAAARRAEDALKSIRQRRCNASMTIETTLDARREGHAATHYEFSC